MPWRPLIPDRLDTYVTPVTLAGVLLCGAVILGGGGTPAPLTELALQLLAAGCALAWLVTRPATGDKRGRAHRLVWLLAGLVLLVPALQLIPLPPSVWAGLPGREPLSRALALVDAERRWWPLSLSPARTLAGLLAMVPALLLMLMIASLAVADRLRLVRLLLALVLVSLLLGAAQLAGGDAGPYLYQAAHRGWLTGFQANRNATADVLLIGLVALAVLTADRTASGSPKHFGSRAAPRTGVVAVLLALLLVTGVVMTGSRMGIALIALTLLGQRVILRQAGQSMAERGGWNIAALLPALSLAMVLALAALALLADHPALRAVAARFAVTGDFRTELWQDAWFAIGQYWPAGAGIGTAVPLLVQAERLEIVDATMPNRVHNDYLEWLLEAGLPGMLALGLAAGLLILLFVRAKRHDLRHRIAAAGGMVMLLIIAVHSLVDYPLRSMALACLAGLAAGLIAPPPGRRDNGEGSTGA